MDYKTRLENTKAYFIGMSPDSPIFEKVRSDGKAAKVNYFARKPRNYDSKKCLPWGDVKGRYQEI